MKKIVPSLLLVSLLALGGALFFTNPNEQDYAQYLAETVSDDIEQSVCQPEGFSKWLGKVGQALSQACQGIVTGGEALSKAEVQQLIVDNTEYQNRILFSTYVTESPVGSYRAIGYFNRFSLQEQTEK